ncbi:hypothetical protein [Ruminococcus flavefaciens]|uniref:hypothetical protein n=1 Tax=Ruminococcus flavefaciens TaxID=1265 RepID=UPI0026EBDA4E|nr:hypothetical protein [Ruminococcus flavefaciens]
MFCKYCGKEIEDNAFFCKYCKKSLHYNEEPAQQEAAETPVPAASPPKKHKSEKSSGFSIASLVLGIIAISVSCFFIYISVPCAIAAIIFGKIAIKNKMKDRKLARFGVNLGIIALGICVVFIAIYLAMVFGLISGLNNLSVGSGR